MRSVLIIVIGVLAAPHCFALDSRALCQLTEKSVSASGKRESSKTIQLKMHATSRNGVGVQILEGQALTAAPLSEGQITVRFLATDEPANYNAARISFSSGVFSMSGSSNGNHIVVVETADNEGSRTLDIHCTKQ